MNIFVWKFDYIDRKLWWTRLNLNKIVITYDYKSLVIILNTKITFFAKKKIGYILDNTPTKTILKYYYLLKNLTIF